ncbi:hypothetical protein ACLQ29_34460 [Micromonospora sp. DT228]|uniref:hypothetical protein n=1 Tax=Micromonospora sp. DT228 TaxID=3393443 RepID=UPI003CF305F2
MPVEGLEQHGEYLPLATDTMVARLIADRIGNVRAPNPCTSAALDPGAGERGRKQRGHVLGGLQGHLPRRSFLDPMSGRVFGRSP